jgi:lysophospholipase L1-like esterase
MQWKYSFVLSWALTIFVIAIGFVGINLFSSYLYGRLQGDGKATVESVLHPSSSIQVSNDVNVSHPYLLYQPKPHLVAHGFVQTNSQGYRGPEIGEKKSGRIRILVLGGSTTFSWAVKDPTKTWVAQFEKLFPKNSVEVINAGAGYATSAELLARYMFKDRYLKPDVVIFHEGGNDVIPMWYPDYNPEYTHFRGPATRPLVGPIERVVLKMPLFKYVYARDWVDASPVATMHPYGFQHIANDIALERSMRGSVEGFERNLDLLIRNIRSDGAVPIIFGFLQNREEFLAKNAPGFIGKERALVVGLARTYEVMQKIAARYSIKFVDPQQWRFPPDVFVDNCHLNEDGEVIKAHVLFEATSDDITRLLSPSTLAHGTP